MVLWTSSHGLALLKAQLGEPFLEVLIFLFRSFHLFGA